MSHQVWSCESLEELPGIADQMLERARDNKVWAFYGEMGVGKTTFIKALCEKLGCEDVVTSPSFSIVNEYRAGGEPVYHFDFYRLKNEQEAYDMGYEEYLYSGAFCFIEWPEKIVNLLPESLVKINLFVENRKRILSLLF